MPRHEFDFPRVLRIRVLPHLFKRPPILGAHDTHVALPRRLVLRAAAGKTVDTQIHKLFAAPAANAMERPGRYTHQIAWIHSKAIAGLVAYVKRARSRNHVKNLLRVVVRMERGRLARFQDNHKRLRSRRLRSIQDQVIGVSREAISDCPPGAEYILAGSRSF